MTARSAARAEFLHDIFVTALEGGIGYWSIAEEYHWHLPEVPGERLQEDLDGFYAVISDACDNEFSNLRIDASVIARGINLISKARKYYDPNGPDRGAEKGDVEFLGKSTARIVRDASFENDASDVDADVADAIVQVGLFGKLVYG